MPSRSETLMLLRLSLLTQRRWPVLELRGPFHVVVAQWMHQSFVCGTKKGIFHQFACLLAEHTTIDVSKRMICAAVVQQAA